MTPKLPAIAAWLLNRFGVPQANESLMGDLVEEVGSGRSAWWFWRQMIAAIADAVARDLRGHWVLALRAVATGWLMNFAWRVVMGAAASLLWRSHLRLYVALAIAAVFAFPTTTGWIVARTHRAQQAAMVLAYAASVAIYGIWGLIDHYYQMKACVRCIPTPWATNPALLAQLCLSVLLTVTGGLIPQPQRETA